MLDRLRAGAAAGFAVPILCAGYASVLAIGLLTLPSPDQAIQNPWFTVMEIHILAIAPGMVAFTVGLHAWTIPERKPLALLSVIFMSMCSVVTCCVHFAVLTLSRHPGFSGPTWQNLVFSFRWPSVAYALDILAWDLFFPLSALFAGLAVHGSGPARGLLFASAALAFIGLVGVPLANMNIRNIGIVGYVILFPIAALLLALKFRRAEEKDAT